MDFKTFYLGLTPSGRDDFADKASTSRGYCNQIAYAGKQIELGMGDVFSTLSGGNVTLAELPLTDRAKQQMKVRSGGDASDAAAPTTKPEAQEAKVA